MLSRLFDRSVRWLTASLAIAALVTALAVPVQAAPRSESGDSPVQLLERITDWLQSLITGSPPDPSADAPREPEEIGSIYATGSQSCIDPYGNPIACPEDD